MNKKFMFAIMAIAAGLVFGSCAPEEEQTEEVVETDTVAVDTVAIDTVAVDTVVEEPVAPAPKKAKAKKQEVKEEEPVAETPTQTVPRVEKKVVSNEGALKTANAPQTVVNGKPARKIDQEKTEERNAKQPLKAATPIKK